MKTAFDGTRPTGEGRHRQAAAAPQARRTGGRAKRARNPRQATAQDPAQRQPRTRNASPPPPQYEGQHFISFSSFHCLTELRPPPTVGRDQSRAELARSLATPEALLTGPGRHPQYSVAVWGAHFSPIRAGAIFQTPARRRPAPRQPPPPARPPPDGTHDPGHAPPHPEGNPSPPQTQAQPPLNARRTPRQSQRVPVPTRPVVFRHSPRTVPGERQNSRSEA